MDEQNILKQFEQIEFNEKYHIYKLNGKRLKSVSSLLKQVTSPFDRDLIAARKAAKMTREGNPTTAQELIVAWEEKGEKSRNLGTMVHQIISSIFQGLLVSSTSTPEIIAFNKWYTRSKEDYRCIATELPIGDADLFGGIGGTIDTLFLRKETGMYHIVDWKTGKMEMIDIWGNLLSPFNYLDKSHINKYSIQLGMYKKILEKNTGIKFGDSFIVHLGSDGEYNEYKAKNFDSVINEWSKSYE